MESKQTRKHGDWTMNATIDDIHPNGYRIRNQTIRHRHVREWEIVKVDQPDAIFPDDLEAFDAAFADCRIKIESKGEM